jgi:hypothetical protein
MNILVTGGCSFSECISTDIDTWPRHLARSLPDYTHVSTGLGSQGNGLISRKILYQVSELLKTTPADDILVGIMWTSPDRQDFYLNNIKLGHNIDGWMENPTSVIPQDKEKHWIILNHNWCNEFAKQYYSTFHSEIGSLLYTCEHILRVQWFLKLHNIKYFMSTFTSILFSNKINYPEVKYLYDQIDFDQFLPVSGEYEWCRDHSGLAFPRNDRHPGSAQHRVFAERVIFPFLQDKKYL